MLLHPDNRMLSFDVIGVYDQSSSITETLADHK